MSVVLSTTLPASAQHWAQQQSMGKFSHSLTLLEQHLQNHSFTYLAESLQTPPLGKAPLGKAL